MEDKSFGPLTQPRRDGFRFGNQADWGLNPASAIEWLSGAQALHTVLTCEAGIPSEQGECEK